MQKVAPVRRNMLERTDDGDGLASDSRPHTSLTAADLKYDYGQIAQASREDVMAAALDIRTHAARAKDSMIKIGLKLSSVKGLLPHGQFGDWCETEFEMSQRSAQRMMQAAEVFGAKIDTVSILSDTAMYLLSGPAVPEVARDEIVLEAQVTGKSPTKRRVQAVIEAHSPRPSKPSPSKPLPPTTYPIPADLAAVGYTVESHPAGGYGVIHMHAQGRVHLPRWVRWMRLSSRYRHIWPQRWPCAH